MSTKGPENRFIASIHRLLDPKQVYVMKNHNEYVGGVADCWYDGRRGDLWVEYKFLELPKRDSTIVDLIGGKTPMLSQLQQEWLRQRVLNKRRVAVVVGTPDGGAWFDDCEWLVARTAGEFRKLLLRKGAIADKITTIVYG